MAALLPDSSEQFCLPCDEEPVEPPPSERIIVPSDVITFSQDDDEVIVIGTRNGKVTRIDGLVGMNNLQVCLTTNNESPTSFPVCN